MFVSGESVHQCIVDEIRHGGGDSETSRQSYGAPFSVVEIEDAVRM